MSNQPTRWRIRPGTDLRWRTWEGETVVYHCPSGDTHLLEPVAAETLRILDDSTATTDALLAEVVARLGIPSDATLRDRFEQLLDRFHELGIVEPFDAVA